jgi:hypothetical protein
VLGHAMAAGPESAILMAEVRAGFRIALLHADAPHFVLKELNWLVHEPDSQVQHPMRCVTGLLDPASGKLRYSTAGQPGVYLVRRSGEAEDLVRGRLPPLGEQPQMEYNLEEAQLEPGESLLLFTRGLITATSAAGEPFGTDPDEPGGRAEQERARDPANAGGRPGGAHGEHPAGRGRDGTDPAADAVGRGNRRSHRRSPGGSRVPWSCAAHRAMAVAVSHGQPVTSPVVPSAMAASCAPLSITAISHATLPFRQYRRYAAPVGRNMAVNNTAMAGFKKLDTLAPPWYSGTCCAVALASGKAMGKELHY